jgi:AcrR family transcriptional regulator
MTASSPLQRVEAACDELAANGQAITFSRVAQRAQVSRTTLYRNPDLRAVVEDHRAHATDARSLTGLAAEIAHLRTGVEAVAERVRKHEERLRRLERHRTENS